MSKELNKDSGKKEEVTLQELLAQVYARLDSTQNLRQNFLANDAYSERAEPLLQHYELFKRVLNQVKGIKIESGVQLDGNKKSGFRPS